MPDLGRRINQMSKQLDKLQGSSGYIVAKELVPGGVCEYFWPGDPDTPHPTLPLYFREERNLLVVLRKFADDEQNADS